MTTTTKRAYKLQEFVAHSLSVNCLKIGRKSSRILVTGGEDHKVNLWSIGKPNALLSLPGHSSGIDSVSFDSSEVLVAAGGASGTIKIWDLEEAKIVRTLTSHRSNCTTLDFHPFGELFASGSLDTNLKIWDIRRKGCLHTYKGHTRGVSSIRFTPDGRWVVSGGEDHAVKLWDLTAGKLMHEFKGHEGQIQCIDFHPHEFLLATGSADRTVKLWDLETFELIGSSGPETSGVRSMTFNPDGKTLMCGLHESLKVVSWEPIQCHDSVDVGWSKLSDLNIHEGKLLGCSYNQSCVGVWVVDISRIEPYSYSLRSNARLNGHSDLKTNANSPSVLRENTTKTNLERLSISRSPDAMKETKSTGRLSASQNLDLKESKSLTSSVNAPSTPQRTSVGFGSKIMQTNSVATPRRNMLKVQSTINASLFNRSEVLPVIVPRQDSRSEQTTEYREDITVGRRMPLSLQSKMPQFPKFSNVREDSNLPITSTAFEKEVPKSPVSAESVDKSEVPSVKIATVGTCVSDRSVKDDRHSGSGKIEIYVKPDSASRFQQEYDTFGGHNHIRKTSAMEVRRAGRIQELPSLERRERVFPVEDLPSISISKTAQPSRDLASNPGFVAGSEEDAISDMMEQHDQFIGSMHSRLAKLQAVRRYWQRHDIRGALSAMEKMADHAVLADVLGLLMEKMDIVTLEICTSLLPLLGGLLESDVDRHQDISLVMLLKLAKVFGQVIYSSLSAPSSVGVDIEAEQRLERCNLCFIELAKVKRCLPDLSRRGGSISKSAQELNLVLQEVSCG
ncbi:hypothetical protein LIER_17414 [Lithospermum erythrorhizon]|uniref:Katanin p80 WD40 repeat-containing subunit B1 homolog n=1 Tax=Lithospermum erythrorhizon TaxID=34254 RepID=A0AAV3QB32_LITER